MPGNDNYQLRSKDVQVVLSTSPKSFIIWGNTVIVMLLAVFLCFLNFYTVPLISEFPFKIISLESKSEQCIEINGFLNSKQRLDEHKTDRNVVLKMVPEGGMKIEELSGLITRNDVEFKHVLVRVQLLKNVMISRYGSTVRLTEGMSGTLEVKTGKISLLHLFKQKINL